ncbi:hypothetical protein M409DRAFT_24528 [Zasmidium cellare ATCC 36951]|uniref:Uncharacterized protein n=1 Tax=Zasmidium cellare ATCC 36951 TaxID=1080233 RepID=A0A6A6CHH3_ZASCE|nr:uncharacterized protein M409DRAFT_24528 [Zasmidium cellare ATCC 36951]KAF2165139.1 hypothetical protein M409DRAFT_24528 [Zasmidium cellare ATCC 36951]
MAASLSSQGTAPPNAPTATSPTDLPLAEQEQVAALMTLTKHLSPAATNEFRRQLREQDNTETRLFKLPAELRNGIFEMAFLDELLANEAKKVTATARYRTSDPTKAAQEPTAETYDQLKALICGPRAMNACRQMRRECRSLLELDKIVITRYTAPGKSHKVTSLVELLRVGGAFFYVSLHDSEEIAHEAAESWVFFPSRGDGAGMVLFPSTLGIKPRSISIDYHEAYHRFMDVPLVYRRHACTKAAKDDGPGPRAII